uniref:F-box domain-containing protein n=2 Tax=Aegilops tauschii subsp. strangulata TaxID=200361 RepID=A0A453E5X1_AEGTS
MRPLCGSNVGRRAIGFTFFCLIANANLGLQSSFYLLSHLLASLLLSSDFFFCIYLCASFGSEIYDLLHIVKMPSETTEVDAAVRSSVECAVGKVISAAKSMGPNSSSPQAETSNSSTHVHSIINSIVEKHRAIWAEEFEIIQQKRFSLMAADISDAISSLVCNCQTDVDASSRQVRDQPHPVGTTEYQVPRPDQAPVDLVRDQQNPPVASEGQVPEVVLNSMDAKESQARVSDDNVHVCPVRNSKDAQDTQVNENVGTEGLVSGDIALVSPDPIEDQSPNFSRGIRATISDDPSHSENVAAPTTPTDANPIGGSSVTRTVDRNSKRKHDETGNGNDGKWKRKKKRSCSAIPLCKPSSDPTLSDTFMAHMSEAGDPFEFLPLSILADILGRVAHTRDIASCRLASRELLAVAYQCPRIRLDASGRAPGLRKGGGGVEGTAFHTLAGNLASRLGSHLRSLVIIASEGQGCPDEATWVEDREFDEADDLHVTSGNSVRAWATTAAGPALQEVEIADFWPQSCWRKAEALPVISHFCHNLLKLALKNAWLSVDGLEIMPNLTHLTLEFIRLDDEDLSKLNECFPCLQILNLIGVGGLENPKIHLSQVKTFRWEVSNAPWSLAIHAPNLVHLELKCVEPEILILDTPSVSTLKLTIDELGPTVQVDGLASLKNLRIESSDLKSLLQLFASDREIRTLDLELPVSVNCVDLYHEVKPDYLVQLFSRITEVKLSPRFSCVLMSLLCLCTNHESAGRLEKLLVHLPASHITACPFVPLLSVSAPSCEVTVLFHADTSDAVRQAAASVWPPFVRGLPRFPEITWRWGTWQ